MGGHLTSTVWIQDGRLYVYRQTNNPGPTHLVGYDGSEGNVRNQIDEVLGLRDALDSAALATDPVDRSRRLANFVRSGDVLGSNVARASALRKLAAGGEAEANALIDLLSDQDLLGWHQDIIQALAGKPVADSQLGKFLGEETTYWSGVCPLKPDWWNDISNPRNESLRGHYTRALALLEAIRARHPLAPITETFAFAAVWRQCSPPGRVGETDQMAEQINVLLTPATR